jgi:hypothetical protein
MIILPVPHNARYVSLSTTFTAYFSAVTAGKYDFSKSDIAGLVNGNTAKIVLPLDKNMIYYIDSLSVGGNIPAEDYLDTIDELPTLSLIRSIGNENLYQYPVPIVQYFQEKQICKYVYSDKADDSLALTFTGKLLQNAGMIGVSPVKINVFLSIYGIDDISFNTQIRDRLSSQFSQKLTR